MSFSFPQLYKNHYYHTIFLSFFGANFFKSSEADVHPGCHSQAFLFCIFQVCNTILIIVTKLYISLSLSFFFNLFLPAINMNLPLIHM